MGSRTPVGSWSSPRLRLDLGRALANAANGQTAPELAESIRQDPSNVRKEADKLVELGMLELATPPESLGVGRRAKRAYRLPDHERDRVAAAASKAAPLGLVREGQHIVVAGGNDAQALDLLEVLSHSEDAAQAAWATMWGGGYIVAFDGADPATAAMNLAAALEGARVAVRRGSIAKVMTGQELVSDARRAARAGLRSRLRSATRDLRQGAGRAQRGDVSPSGPGREPAGSVGDAPITCQVKNSAPMLSGLASPGLVDGSLR